MDATPMSKPNRALMLLVAAASLIAADAGRAQALPHPRPGVEPGSASAPREPASFVAQLPQRRSLTLAEAITIAQSRHPGRVVRAQTIEMGNGAVHEIRIIGNDGRVHTVRVDARTGMVQ
jgi:uncharacterized membrane protein YkoI